MVAMSDCEIFLLTYVRNLYNFHELDIWRGS